MPLTYPGGAIRRLASAELAAICVMSSTGSVGRSSIASSLSPRASHVACAAHGARDRSVREPGLQRPQALTGLQREPAEDVTSRVADTLVLTRQGCIIHDDGTF